MKTVNLRRSQSMEVPPKPLPPCPTPPAKLLSKRSPLIEFPTSPQLIVGEEITHFGHPQHLLSKINLPDLFTCAGCKEYGAGKRFSCQECDFQLHDFCALPPSQAIEAHPFHCQHHLHFQTKPVKGGITKSRCDACSKPVNGYAFRCAACHNFQMHPSCAMLPEELSFSNHPHNLKLLPVMATSSGGDAYFVCGECRRRRSGRVYCCMVCDYHLHAVCAKSTVNGLHDNGIKGHETLNILRAVFQLASQVIIEFIGGLIEGLGEGVGEVLVQNIAKGRSNGRD